LDNAFLQTWYDIRADAVDNILNATPIWAMLKSKGCFKGQTGSEYITRTLRYGVGVTPQEVGKGDLLPMGVVETETMARWTFRNLAANIQRDTITDAENAGSAKINYVKQRLGEARDALTQRYETDVMRAINTAETGKNIQSLFDLLPLYTNATTGTYGAIARPATFAQIAAANGVYAPATGNTFWGSKYKQMTAPYEVNLVSDMKVLFNSVQNNQEAPDMLVSDQATYELYEEFAVDKSQIVKNDSKMLADLGFQNLEFKGKAWIWTPNAAVNSIMMLNTNFIEVVYRTNLWFEMTDWKDIPNQMERVAHIISSMNIIGAQPRRHGLLTSATVS
jgi:hypothetical protein